jgi:hypothetical protein
VISFHFAARRLFFFKISNVWNFVYLPMNSPDLPMLERLRFLGLSVFQIFFKRIGVNKVTLARANIGYPAGKHKAPYKMSVYHRFRVFGSVFGGKLGRGSHSW